MVAMMSKRIRELAGERPEEQDYEMDPQLAALVGVAPPAAPVTPPPSAAIVPQGAAPDDELDSAIESDRQANNAGILNHAVHSIGAGFAGRAPTQGAQFDATAEKDLLRKRSSAQKAALDATKQADASAWHKMLMEQSAAQIKARNDAEGRQKEQGDRKLDQGDRALDEKTKDDAEKRRIAEAAAKAKMLSKSAGKSAPKAVKGADGKLLPATTVGELSSLPVAEQQVDHAVDEFNRLNMGGTSGRISGAVTDALGLRSTDAAEYDAVAKLAMQAAGKILEGGKLAAGDEVKYRAMFPRPGDSPEVVEQKRVGMKAYLRELQQTHAKGLKDSGYNVPSSLMGGDQPQAPAGKVPMVSLASGNTIFISPETAKAGLAAKTLKAP